MDQIPQPDPGAVHVAVDIAAEAMEPVIERVVRRVLDEQGVSIGGTSNHSKPIMDKREATNYLGLSVRTLDRIIEDHDIPVFKDKGVVRIRREDLDALFTRGTPTPGGEDTQTAL